MAVVWRCPVHRTAQSTPAVQVSALYCCRSWS
jgi:hypothetical protein